MKFTPIYLPKSPNNLSVEQQKRMNNNITPETSHSNQEKTASLLTCEKITNDMQQIKSQLDVDRDGNSCLMPVKKEIKQEPDYLCNPDTRHLAYSSRPEKVVEKLQPRRNPETGDCSSQSDQIIIPMSVSEKLSTIPKEEPLQIFDARNHALVSTGEKCTSTEREKVSANLVSPSSSSVGVHLTQSDQEKFSCSSNFEKVKKLQPRRNPEPVVAESKGLDDGYNWRKYGQKLVKGNKFIRSYYKCTHPNCQAKRQVEKSHDGIKTDVNFLGNHYHPKPQNSPQVNSTFLVRISDTPIVSTSKSDAESTIDHGGESQHIAPTGTLLLQSTVAGSVDSVTGAVSFPNYDNNNDKDAKRLKREVTSADDNVVNKPNSDLRRVVQTPSEVDLVNDGYRWRKYGQKMVKGNPNPRSYYRCSYAGCPVKKHVERASHDPKLVITTYEGQHDHGIMPASRTVNQSTAASGPEENKNNPVALDMAVHVSLN